MATVAWDGGTMSDLEELEPPASAETDDEGGAHGRFRGGPSCQQRRSDRSRFLLPAVSVAGLLSVVVAFALHPLVRSPLARSQDPRAVLGLEGFFPHEDLTPGPAVPSGAEGAGPGPPLASSRGGDLRPGPVPPAASAGGGDGLHLGIEPLAAAEGGCARYGCQHAFVASQPCQCDEACAKERDDCCLDFAAACQGKDAARDADFQGKPSAAALMLERTIAESLVDIQAKKSAEEGTEPQTQEIEEAADILEELMRSLSTAQPTPPPAMTPEPIYQAPTTTTTSRWEFPSFFCWTVVRTDGYEVPLIKAQHANQVGIFACDEYSIYSNGGVLQISPTLATMQLAVPTVGKGDFSVAGTTTNSWLNTLIFMEAWALIVADDMWWNHEWTVKIDPDAVFFPHRLRELMLVATPPSGEQPRFVGNCDRSWHNRPARLKLFGSIEIFSRDAVGAYKAFGHRCKTELDWKGWGEDYFMQSCMNILGAKPINGTSFLADKRCHWAPCTDDTKIAYHDFKTVQSYFDCWGQSRQSEKQIMPLITG